MPSRPSCLLLVLSPGLEFIDDTRNVFRCVRCQRSGCLSDTLPWGSKAGQDRPWLTIPFLDVSIQNEAFRAISNWNEMLQNCNCGKSPRR